MASGIKAEGVRLDRALEQLGEADEAGFEHVELTRFDEVLRLRERKFGQQPDQTLTDEIFDVLMPMLDDPTVLRGMSFIKTLEDLAAKLEPYRGSSDRLEHWGSMIMRDELRKHRVLRSYVNSLVEP